MRSTRRRLRAGGHEAVLAAPNMFGGLADHDVPFVPLDLDMTQVGASWPTLAAAAGELLPVDGTARRRSAADRPASGGDARHARCRRRDAFGVGSDQ